MFRRFLPPLLLLALAFGAVASFVPGAPADGEVWSARLLDLTSSYGSEAWKYDLGYEGQASPSVVAAHLENQTTSYYGALGLRVGLKVQLFRVDDPNAQPTSSHNVSAYIPTSRGPLYALVKREGTSATFHLDFDMDGANNVAPNGQTPPPADPGLQAVQLNVFRRASDNPRPEPAGEAQFQFTYNMPYGTATNPAFAGLLHQQPVPDSLFRLYTDIGADRSVQYFFRPIEPSQTLELSYDVGTAAAGQTVDLLGFLAERGVAQQAPGGPAPAPLPTPPFVPGVSDNQTLQSLVKNSERLVVVNTKTLATSRVDAAGGVRFVVRGENLAAIDPQPAPAALVALAPLLVDNFDPAGCPGDCRGGAQYRVGATEIVVPVSGRHVSIDGYQLADPNASGNQAPENLRDVAIAVNSLRVRVRDAEGFAATDTRAGDLFAVVPDARSTTALSGTRLARTPPDDPTQRQSLLAGDLSVRAIQAQHVSFYRVLALLYESNDAFYGAGFGDRGYNLQLNAPVAIVPPGAGGVWVNVTSRTTNYDALADDPLFDLKVFYSVSVPDLGVNETRALTLHEGRAGAEFIPLSSGQPGSFPVTVDSTSGDVLPRESTIDAQFREPPPKRGLVDRLPGPQAPVLLALVAALVFLGRRD